jgi:NNP family nitrate/nitrite transporter-like MFS transporter
MNPKHIFQFPLMPLLSLVIIFYLNFVSRVIYVPLLPIIEAELGIGHGEVGALFLFIAGGYCIGLLGSGFASSRIRPRWTIIFSTLAVGFTMLIVSQLTTIRSMRVGLIFVGVFAGFYLPAGIVILTDQINKKHWGKAISIHEIAPNLGFITAPLIAEFLLKWFSWRGVLATIGITVILTGVIFVRLRQNGNHSSEISDYHLIPNLVSIPSFWMMSALFAVSIGARMGVYTMLPLFLVTEIGMDRPSANTVIGLSQVSGTVIIFLSGLLADRIGHKRAIMLFLTMTGIFTLLLGVVRGPVVTPLLIILQSTLAVCFFPAGFAMVSLIFPSYLRNLAVSMIMIIGFILGWGAIPLGIGYVADRFSFSLGFVFLGALTFITLPLFLCTKTRVNGDRQGW